MPLLSRMKVISDWPKLESFSGSLDVSTVPHFGCVVRGSGRGECVGVAVGNGMFVGMAVFVGVGVRAGPQPAMRRPVIRMQIAIFRCCVFICLLRYHGRNRQMLGEVPAMGQG